MQLAASGDDCIEPKPFKKELFDNINDGKKDAIKYLSQVYRSIRSEQRNKQEEAFIKLNLQKSVDCNE